MIFTFYSYKGGVGRSMALAAVARALALRGLRVLAVDFDLEAPGLERYFHDSEASRARRAEPGLIDLIGKYKEALTDEAAFARAEFRQLDRYQLPAIHTAGTRGGSVHLLSAGRREPEERLREYALTVRGFDWQDFFFNWKGDRFFDWLRRRWLAEDGGYDVVLVDSRTGVTEMGGVCTYQLADAVVMLCAPNWQNLEGTRDVARDFVSDSVRALRRGKPLQTLAIPARLAREHPRLHDFLERFAQEMGVLGLPKALADAGLDYERLALHFDAGLSVGEMVIGGGDAASAPGADGFDADIERLASALLLLTEAGGALGSARAEAAALLAGHRPQAALPLEADTTRTSAGYDAFIDYGPEDEQAAQRLAERLEAAGCRVFLDPTAAALPIDSNWQRLALALSYSAHLLMLFGHSSASPARERLLASARHQGRTRVVAVLMPGAELSALRSFGLETVRTMDLRQNDEDWSVLLDLLKPEHPDLARTGSQAAPAPDPYPGTRAFDESDAARFKGREAETRQLADAILHHSMVLLEGPAQVGKTSLVRAGLVPWLRQEHEGPPLRSVTWIDAPKQQWVTPLYSPSAHGVAFDLVVIDHLDSHVATGLPARERIERLKGLVQRAHAGCKLLIVRRGIIQETVAEVFKDGPFVLQLEALAEPTLRQAIEVPARDAGQLLEPGLADRLVESAGPARSAIVQIQRVLEQLWPRRRRGWLTNQALDEIGHLDGVFARHAAEVIGALPTHQRMAVRAMLLAMVTLDGQAWRPRPRAWPSLASLGAFAKMRHRAESLRDLLAGQGLIDLWWEAGTGAATVAPVRPEVRVYFDAADAAAAEDLLSWRQAVEPRLAAWQTQPDNVQNLLSESALDEARRWLQTRPDLLLAEERRFIEASVARHVLQLPSSPEAPGDAPLEAVSGRDVVSIELPDGPTLALHPESARELLDANQRSGGSLSKQLWSALKVLTGVPRDPRPFIDQLREFEGPIGRLLPSQPGADPFPSDTAAAPVSMLPSGAPVLVLIPGTLVDARATFNGLWRDGDGAAWTRLREGYGERICALAHHSLGADPLDNALALAQRCAPGTRLHLLTHGTGGLVAEVLVRASVLVDAELPTLEASLRERAALLAQWVHMQDIAVERVVRVAGPVRGQLFASRRLDMYLSLLVWCCESAGAQVPPAARALLLQVASQRIDPASLPGTAACLPDSALLRWLPAAPEPAPRVRIDAAPIERRNRGR
jgi:hypothetical protein